MTLGPIMLDIEGLALTADDREVLRHPLVGGVILFSRNYQDPAQLTALVADIHALRTPALLVAVDQEGGRVQRFRSGFTALPAARMYGKTFDGDAGQGLRLAEMAGWLMAAELLACGVDISFAPVLDLDHGVSSIIGNRAFHRTPDGVRRLAQAWIQGMRRAGMAATGKHFPGHGGIAADSHTELPVDNRPFADLAQSDMRPFEQLFADYLPAVMMAHVVYPQTDTVPASVSRRWIQNILRRQMDFRGAVFCDDLSMTGIAGLGDYPARASAALAAGCDMLPVCNNRPGVVSILDTLPHAAEPVAGLRLARLRGQPRHVRSELLAGSDWQHAVHQLAALLPEPELNLDF